MFQRIGSTASFLVVVCGLTSLSPAQININQIGMDGVLNAPYRGTIASLHQATSEMGYGEVFTRIEPNGTGSSSTINPNYSMWIWYDSGASYSAWDRSVLRLYHGVDGTGQEIDLTSCDSQDNHYSITGPGAGLGDVERFSLRALSTKTLAPIKFRIWFRYGLGTGSPTNYSRDFAVQPMTASFLSLPGESEAFHYGTRLLEVQAGNARLTIPTGRRQDSVGGTYIEHRNMSSRTLPRYEVVLPWAGEAVYVQHYNQFVLSTNPYGFMKSSYGTPWPRQLLGFQVIDTSIGSSEPDELLGADGTRYYAPEVYPSDGFGAAITENRPLDLPNTNAACVFYEYDSALPARCTGIRDGAGNRINLNRNGTTGALESVSTSDGRSWTIQTDANGWITGVVPAGGKGARYYKYSSASSSLGRVTQVRLGASDGGDPNNPDLGDQIMYKFVYDTAGDLREEWRSIDGSLRKAVEHIIVDEGHRRRRDYIDADHYRQTDYYYDAAGALKHRLTSIARHSMMNPDDADVGYVTTFTHDYGDTPGSMGSAKGQMIVTREDLPDGTWITHDYDKHVGLQTCKFGLLTKSVHHSATGELTTYDVDYESFMAPSGSTRVYHVPRIAKQRDGRHNPPAIDTERTFAYETGTSGDVLRRLLSITGPTISLGTSGARAPQTRFTYNPSTMVLAHQETDFASGQFRSIDYGYDNLLRLTSEAVDPNGINSVTQYQYFDALATQDRITIDPDNYYTKTTFDNDGRVATVQRYLTAGGATGKYYGTTNMYDANGRLDQQDVDNKDQNGDPLPAPAPATFVTEFTHDRLGRLLKRAVDPNDINSEANYKYDWQGDVIAEFDTSGRGVARTFEGRGLVVTETPLQENTDPGQPDEPGLAVTALTTKFTYDSMGRRTAAEFESQAAREKTTTEHDDFGRVWKTHRVPGTDGGDTYTTTYEYDNASNVTRTVLTDGSETWSDATALYDEGGFNYESRQRLGAGVDGNNDPVTRRKFDWAGNVTEERGLAAATPDDAKDRIISTHYDGANRVDYVTDSLGGRTDFGRDGRGNITEQTVKLNGSDNAVTSSEYDALSRAIHVTSPADSAGGRPDAMRAFDSRGNLIRETLRDAADSAKMSTFFFYDAAGRQERRVVLGTAMPHDPPFEPELMSADLDRFTEFSYDADGRLQDRTTYNNNNALWPLVTTTTYDALGRVYSVTDPSDSYFIDDYSYIPPPGLTVDGRLHKRTVSDGAGAREFTFTFDGHDRVKEQTAVGTGGDPNLTTAFQHDPLDRQSYVTDPRGIVRRTRYWMTGWLGDTTEDWGGAQERFTDLAYNKLGQLTTQTAKNKAGDGTALADQVTRYRYDSLGRTVRTVYPDSVSNPDDPNCVDCVKAVYDVGGRMTSRTDQRGLQTVFTYDKRSQLLARTTGTGKDTFDYDALGRLRLAKRGTTANDDEVSSSVMAYNGLGDLDHEDQAIAEGTVRRTDYDYDQAGNRKSLAYPGGTAVGYTPTELNQVATITLNGGPLVAYTYAGGGHPLANRRVTTAEPGGSTHYDHAVAYNTSRQIKTITNSFTSSVKATQTVAEYTFTRDGNGNPLTQTVEGRADFAEDDRVFSVDRLNRLTGTDYAETGNSESAVLDLQGNRESHAGRDAVTRSYTLANGANEYATIDPDGSGGGPAASVSYDAAGNLLVDEAGRQYEYDEQNRLVRVTASDDTVMAEYSYDALGRRIWSWILGTAGSPAVATRYYYDGSRMIEERDGSDARRRYHVNGGQYIDEHVGTLEDGAGRAGEAIYYLSNLDYSVAGTGNADGSVIERLDYTSSGDFVEGGTAPCVRGDVSGDGRIDGRDAQTFIGVLLGLDTNEVHICAADIDVSGGVDLTDVPLLVECLLAGGCPAEVECTRADVNDDGHVDGRDAQPFVNVLLGLDTNAVHTCAADIDDSGVVDLTDAPLFVQCLLAGGCGGGPPLCRRGDVDNDGLVTIADVGPFVGVLLSGTGSTQQVCAVDVDGNDIRDGRDIQPFVDCLLNAATCPPDPPGFAGVLPDGAAERKIVPLTPGVTDEPALQPRSNRAGPDSGTFAMHGCPIDVLSDGLILQYNRARYYDVRSGRWLQRDPAGYVDGENLYEAFRDNPLVNADPAGEDAIETDAAGDLVYTKEPGWGGKHGFTWRFARQVSAAVPDLMLIDHDAWPYAFLMTRQNAMSEFNTWAWEEDYSHHGQFLQRAAQLATQEPDKVIAVLDKRCGHAAWIVPGQVLDTSDVRGGDRTLAMMQLANANIQHRMEGVAYATEVAYTATTGALAGAAGTGAMVVDAAVAVSDIARGNASVIAGGVVVTAVVAGVALHLRFASKPVGTAESPWRLAPTKRGLEIEGMLGKNTPSSFPVVDIFRNGQAISIKSIDLTAATYQDARQLRSVLERYVDKVAEFQGGAVKTFEVDLSQIRSRGLQVAVPAVGQTAQQRAVIEAVKEYGRSRGVAVSFIEVP